MKGKTLLLAICFVIFWNSGFIGADHVLPQTEPFTLLFWRYLGLSLLLFFYLVLRKRLHWPGWKIAAPNMMIGLLAHGVWLGCTFFAFKNGVSAGMVALVIALQPIATGALSGLMTGEKTRKVQWLGLIIGFSGVAFSVIFRMKTDNEATIFGYLILLGSVLSISIANLIQRQLELKNAMNKLRTEQSLFYQSMATASAAFLPAVFFEGLSAEWDMEFTLSLSWLILGVSLMAYGLMGKLLERISATKVSSLFYLGPPVTMIMAWILLGDKIHITDLFGLLIVLSGLMLTQIDIHKYLKSLKKRRTIFHGRLQPRV